jgi:hypothetical protein
MAYLYTFSTLNYGIGIGLFLVALSVFLYQTERAATVSGGDPRDIVHLNLSGTLRCAGLSLSHPIPPR